MTLSNPTYTFRTAPQEGLCSAAGFRLLSGMDIAGVQRYGCEMDGDAMGACRPGYKMASLIRSGLCSHHQCT